MSRFLQNLPVKHKLTFITMATCAAALLLSGASFMAYESAAFRRELVANRATIAEMTGFNCASALSFNDASSAGQTLKGFAAQAHIMAACVYDQNGAVFATYQRDQSPVAFAPPPGGSLDRFETDQLDLFRPIVFDGETIGTIYLRSDLRELHDRLRRYALIVSGAGLMAMLIAYVIAARLRRVITEPVSQLSIGIARVTTEKDFSIRVERSGNDELGRLVDGFNEMLGQIQTRDADLKKARDDLERRVEERTTELAYERDQLRALLDSSPDAIYFKDRDSRFVLISRSKAEQMRKRVPGLRERLFGPGAEPETPVDPGKFIGLADADVYTTEHANRTLADEREIMRTGQPLVGKIEQQTYLDGSVFWSLTNKMPWQDKEGLIVGTFAITKDITELKLAEQKLEQMHRQLLETSRAAGMAEVATAVLHNVGNVLNSVNVSATLVADAARHSKAGNLGKLSALLAEHQHDLAAFLQDDPRGKMVQPYLASLAENIAREQQSMLTELDHLRKNVDHIKDIVAMQQNYAKTSGIIEAISIPDLVEDALRMNAGSLARHDIGIVREYHTRPVVALDKHKVLQILVNLVRNAKYACDESGRIDRRMTLRITTEERFVSIAVIDNGVGIPPENLTRIFGHGFTTRAKGHGFGLHSGALAAKEMGGSLHAHSDGPGRGAAFILTLPFKPEIPHEEPIR